MGRRSSALPGSPLVLTEIERRTVQELASGKHETLASALVAGGYSQATASKSAGRMLAKPAMQAAITEAMAQHGYTFDTAAQSLAEGALRSERMQVDGKGGEHFSPDWMSRVKHHELIAKMTGLIAPTLADGGGLAIHVDVHLHGSPGQAGIVIDQE